ncbi:MAG: hypothetical protein J6S67_07160 [Methanobrevibacter sp.]|nr:hypothetical protein [Methanobrevibacter sp.]
MELKELNHAGEQGVFGSIRVLGDIDSKNLKLIKRDVNKVQNQQYNLNTKIDDYWASLSDDGIITAGEKKALKSEWDTIQQTFAALLAQATAKALVSTSYWQAYQDAYDDLKELLYVTEKVFNDMYTDTTLTDKDNWNDIFKAYYYQEQFVQVAIMTGLIDKLGLRVLDSLEDPGVEGELAFYKGELYQYTDGAWCRVGTESYLGIRTELPDAPEENQYFLAGDIIEFLDDLVINDEVLYINDDVLGIKRLTRYGFMYYWNGTNWFNVPDEDPRYLAVLADYITLNGELPYVLEVRITQVAEDTVRNPNKTPKYLGPSNTIPVGASKQDYFLYTGITAGDWVKNHIYRYNGEAWQHLNPSNDGNSRYYMTVLQDILTLEEAGDGYFSSLFCDAFFTNKASINALKVQIIYLYDTGVIQSENETYVPQSVGLLIDASGNIDANKNTHIGGNCTIDGNTTISGNAVISGRLNGATGSFSGSLSGATGSFSGVISAKGFTFDGIMPGDIAVITIYDDEEEFNPTNTYKIVGNGTYRFKIGAYSVVAPSRLIRVYKNGNVIWEMNTKYEVSTSIDVDCAYGDVIKIVGDAAWVQICTDSNNDVMAVISRPYNS